MPGIKDFSRVSHVISNVLEQKERQKQRREGITGIPTGFTDIDQLTAGLQYSELTLLAGRPSIGKTALMLSLAYHVAAIEEVGVAIFGLEMSKEQLGQRLLSVVARVDSQKMRNGKIYGDDEKRVGRASKILEKAPIYINDTPAISLNDLRIQIKKLTDSKNIGLVFVDYLQLMRGGSWHKNRESEIKEILSGLKNLAIEYNIHVVVLSQLPNAIEERKNKRPKISDLPEFYLDYADNILLLYRSALYKKKKTKKNEAVAEVIIAKQNNGLCGTAELCFIPEITCFDNFSIFDDADC